MRRKDTEEKGRYDMGHLWDYKKAERKIVWKRRRFNVVAME